MADQIQIEARQIKLTPISRLRPSPKNRNKHPEEQIERLVELIKYQGFRQPIIVSNQSGFVVTGHGRLEAAKRAGLTEVPVVFQDFESDEQEHAFQISDNAIASWAELDLRAINADLGDFGPDFAIDMLGIEGFTLDKLPDFSPGSEDDQGKLDHKLLVILECPHCHEQFEQGQARVFKD